MVRNYRDSRHWSPKQPNPSHLPNWFFSSYFFSPFSILQQMVVNCGELSCHRSPKQPLRSITFSQLIASEWLHPTDCIQPTTRIYNSYTSSLAAALLLARTTGVINTVRGYHATSCSLVWFAVYRMGRQTQLWSGPMRELVALALWLQNLCFPISQTRFKSGRLGHRHQTNQSGIFIQLIFTFSIL